MSARDQWRDAWRAVRVVMGVHEQAYPWPFWAAFPTMPYWAAAVECHQAPQDLLAARSRGIGWAPLDSALHGIPW